MPPYAEQVMSQEIFAIKKYNKNTNAMRKILNDAIWTTTKEKNDKEKNDAIPTLHLQHS
jgi:hypothetical protein